MIVQKHIHRTVYILCIAVSLLGCSTTAIIKHPSEDAPAPKVVGNPWQPSEACINKANQLVEEMTIDEKAGQMAQVAVRYLRELEDVSKYSLGSMLAGGTDFPTEDLSGKGWAGYIDTVSVQATKSRLKIPLLFGIDAVHGNGKSTDAVVFPHNIGLGCTGDDALIHRIAEITAIETRGSGVNWAFSPVLAAARDERWGRTYESFGETPELATSLGKQMVLGLQGNLKDETTVLACAKHFAGDGTTEFGTSHMENAFLDRGNSTLTDDDFWRIAIEPYIPSIEAGVGSIMISYSSYMGTKMHAEKNLITNVLKGQLGFNGFIVSDWMGIDDIEGDFKSDITIAINAGIDMVMIPNRYVEFIENLKELVPSKIPTERIDDAVKRILTVKCEMGMFEPNYSPLTPGNLTTQIGNQEHRTVAREAVAKSLVLLKNDNSLLPLSKDTKIVLAGSGADNLDKQCGGWTVTWQGEGHRMVGGTSVKMALENAVGKDNVIYVETISSSAVKEATVGVVVVGENPYAEWYGDRDNLELDSADLETIQKMSQTGLPFVVILFSGRPMIINDPLSQSTAWIAAWQPGTEGDGIADVLFGDVPPQGTLSHTWPKEMAQLPINVEDKDSSPLFPLGFGLNYK